MPAIAQDGPPSSVLDLETTYTIPVAKVGPIAGLKPHGTSIQWTRPQEAAEVIHPGGSDNYFTAPAANAGAGLFYVSWGVSASLPAPRKAVRFSWPYAFFFSEYIRISVDAFNYGTWYCLGVTWDATIPKARFYLGTESTPMVELAYTSETLGAGPIDNPTQLGSGPHTRDDPVTVYPGQGPQIYVPHVLSLGEMESWRFRPRMLAGALGFFDWGTIGADLAQPDLSGNGLTMVRGGPGGTLPVAEVPGANTFSLMAGCP